ncbi:hypothetical protein EVAR_86999_1 [Eumeta japonica]|uniref:Uncharacterized protein n=1 Tax=Eumeta variegata TaxID=151549 RepID=A0A4C1W5V8_EUMVA|nr:hypothetical protein EVAR_86999_1 [Eumeta japonica]
MRWREHEVSVALHRARRSPEAILRGHLRRSLRGLALLCSLFICKRESPSIFRHKSDSVSNKRPAGAGALERSARHRARSPAAAGQIGCESESPSCLRGEEVKVRLDPLSHSRFSQRLHDDERGRTAGSRLRRHESWIENTRLLSVASRFDEVARDDGCGANASQDSSYRTCPRQKLSLPTNGRDTPA